MEIKLRMQMRMEKLTGKNLFMLQLTLTQSLTKQVSLLSKMGMEMSWS